MVKNSQGTILIADDDEGIVIGLSAFLTDEGYQVDTAYDGLQALQKMQTNDFEIVIVDLKMPEIDGIGLLHEKKNKGILAEFIVISGKGTIDTAVKAMKLGAYDYLTKPVDPKRLLTLIQLLKNVLPV
jgi:two-component system nitrogen regulation response regulator NtrX